MLLSYSRFVLFPYKDIYPSLFQYLQYIAVQFYKSFRKSNMYRLFVPAAKMCTCWLLYFKRTQNFAIHEHMAKQRNLVSSMSNFLPITLFVETWRISLKIVTQLFSTLFLHTIQMYIVLFARREIKHVTILYSFSR